jgi:hypothetical protein
MCIAFYSSRTLVTKSAVDDTSYYQYYGYQVSTIPTIVLEYQAQYHIVCLNWRLSQHKKEEGQPGTSTWYKIPVHWVPGDAVASHEDVTF